ncbi:unnamed protein product [Pedinophyceae sp. YPF-701]|nr:unnamed protein product [Pedinophyceae sp. YPF-701]
MSDSETYEAALAALSGLISGKSRGKADMPWESYFAQMHEFVAAAGLTEKLKDIAPRVVHVAGTKGKGSTCAMIESILRQCNYDTGMFTSPHLLDVRERIRLQGEPVDRETFLRHFWPLYRRLQGGAADGSSGMPAYFRFLTLLALDIFCTTREQTEVIVLEVGLGGRLDATNIIPPPAVCGVTRLDLDHVELLGPTIEDIAREKAGIFKRGTPAFTGPQRPEALAVLEREAERAGTHLLRARPLDAFRCYDGRRGTDLSIFAGAGYMQENAALAVAMASAFEDSGPEARRCFAARERLELLAQGVLPEEYCRGLEAATWPGRAQVVEDVGGRDGAGVDGAGLTFFLDGAHTPDSMRACGTWFAAAAAARAAPGGGDTERVLVFNCTPERDPAALLAGLRAGLPGAGAGFFRRALFIPPDSDVRKVGVANEEPGMVRDLSWQAHALSAWRKLAASDAAPAAPQRPAPPLPAAAESGEHLWATRGAVVASLGAGVEWLRSHTRSRPAGSRLQVLVTGSLYLVGDTLRYLPRR